MRAKSASTTIVDPYRAALSLGQSLSAIAPEIVFLFVTVHYEDWTEFMDGLYDGLGDPAVRIIGASGDGFYESSRVSDMGAAALGLAGGGAVAWHLASGEQVGTDPEGAVRGALAALAQQLDGHQPAFYFMASDFNTDASRIEAVLRDEVPVPVIGGMAADDNSGMGRACVFADRTPMRDALVMLAVDGPLAFQVHVGNSISPVGSSGIIDDADGKILRRIGGLEAVAFVERETGKPILRSDQGIALAILGAADAGEKTLRAVAQNVALENGALSLFGGIRVGERVQVCVTQVEDLEAEVRAIAARAAASGFEPAAALVASCAGRKWLLGGQIKYEAEAIGDAFQRHVPLAGFSSFGEIGPLFYRGRYTRNLFHNVTYVVLLLGAACAC